MDDPKPGPCRGRGWHHTITMSRGTLLVHVCAHCRQRMTQPWQEPVLSAEQCTRMAENSQRAHRRLCRG